MLITIIALAITKKTELSMKKWSFLIFLSLLILNVSCEDNNEEKSNKLAGTYLTAPFTGIDTIATNDWWNRKPNPIIDVKVKRDQVIAFGIYTVSNNTLKLTAQLFPLFPDETKEVKLLIKEGGNWKEIQRKKRL